MMVSPAELLSTHVQMLHHHFQTYYQTLDLDVSKLLFPTWHNPSLQKPFLCKVEEMECSITLILPGIMNRYRASQSGFIDKVGYDWIHSSGKSEILKACKSGDVMAQMEELVCVVS
ncbi:hypothetical protein MKW94_028496 [Papaver nudicaule]|uniref:Uncharacterized protein n=1 Tax=Papaver nudicaule TaxID=74823 RepID=A0AA41S3F5_PAPNU|nr:hypothetical protein [Papaver nudicaule]